MASLVALVVFAAPPTAPIAAQHSNSTSVPTPANLRNAPQLRRPIDAAFLPGGSLLAVANGRSGTVSVVDVVAAVVRGETRVAAALGGLIAVPPNAGETAAPSAAAPRLLKAAAGVRGELLVTDADAHRLLLATVDDGGAATVVRAVPTSRHPGAIRIAPDNDTISVACRWAHSVDLISLKMLRTAPGDALGDAGSRGVLSDATLPRRTGGDASRRAVSDDSSPRVKSEANATLLRTVELPFPPRDLVWLPDGRRLVVTDAAGGRLAVVDAAARKVVARCRLTGHNLRGPALSADGKSLLVAHQILNETAAINWQTVHSGTLMNNVVSQIPLDALGDAKAEVADSSERDLDGVRTLIPVGMTGHGAGDPSAVLPLANGGVAVLAAGTGELLVINRYDVITGRIGVGARPVRLVAREGGSTASGAKGVGEKDGVAVVVNSLDDSVSFVTLDGPTETKRIPLGPRPPEKAADRGERLFFSSRVSHDGWLSCHSCHTDGHSNGLRADTLGDGSLGAPKRVLDLGHVAFTDKWAWNGQMQELLEQVRKSMLSTMLSDSASDAQAADLLTYLETLLPAPPRHPASNAPTEPARADRARVERGRTVFLSHNCQQCHVPPLTFAASDVYDVGLSDEHGNRKFNPPSLRGVGHRPRLFHDNRATSLDDVFQGFGHPNDTALSDEERADLVRYLNSL